MQAASGVHSCPAFIACYNEELRTLCYVNSGHTPGLVRDSERMRELKATALPLGLFSHSVPDSSLVALQPGNALLLVSKGIVEAKYRGEEYGMERVKQYFQSSAFETAHETCVGILASIQQFMGTAPTHNDVTALSVVRSGVGPRRLVPGASRELQFCSSGVACLPPWCFVYAARSFSPCLPDRGSVLAGFSFPPTPWWRRSWPASIVRLLPVRQYQHEQQTLKDEAQQQDPAHADRDCRRWLQGRAARPD